MIGHTKAFSNFRSLSQAHLDFVVLVCHAIPALQPTLKSDLAATYRPDHFKVGPETIAQLKRFSDQYQDELSRSTLITIFSYFEAYVRDALKEIVDFHGGELPFKSLARRRAERFVVQMPSEIENSKRKLQEYPKKAKHEKYTKYSKLLGASGFRFPTELLAYLGAIQIVEKTNEKRGMRAWEIPNMLYDALLFPLSKTDRDQYEDLRLLRNKIAHGKPAPLTLQRSLRAASSLHKLAARIDKHILEHFLVIEEFS